MTLAGMIKVIALTATANFCLFALNNVMESSVPILKELE
jgi:hypothetical protein